MNAVGNATPAVVYGEVPSGVNVAVEKYPCSYVLSAFFDSGYVMTLFYLEKPVDNLKIKAELQNHNQQSNKGGYNTDKGIEEVKYASQKGAGYGDINPAVKGIGGNLKTFHLSLFASAVVHQNFGHIITRQFFALGTGGALGNVFANVGDFVHHILGGFVSVVNQFLKFAHTNPPCINYTPSFLIKQ